MSRRWSDRSAAKLKQVDARLVKALDYALQYGPQDMTIVTGHRPRAEQDAAFRAGRSKVQWPKGKHNSLPSKAVDIQPYPYPASNQALREQLGVLAGFIRGVYAMQNDGALLRWGGDWDRDGDTADNTFDDLFHLEIDE